MASKIQIKRGSENNIPILNIGEPAFTTDTNKFFIGNGSSNIEFAKTDITTTDKNGLMSSIDKIKLDNIQENANNYILPVATPSILGGVMQGSNIEIDANGIISSNKGNGLYSVAEGYLTIADGNYSHAEGHGSIASANITHAEGRATLATNGTVYIIQSFDDANKTINLDNVNGLAISDKIDIFINDSNPLINISIKNISGQIITLDTTININSNWKYIIKKVNSTIPTHAEGYNTLAAGDYSHVEGLYNKAIGNISHVEGDTNIANGISSHAEGNICIANGISSHVEGGGNIANGNYSHAEGYHTTSTGQSSHVEGSQNYVHGMSSHAEGYYNSIVNGNVYVINNYDNTNKTLTLNNIDNLIVGANLDIFLWDNQCIYTTVTAINGNTVTIQGIDSDITIDDNWALAAYGNLTSTQAAHAEGYNNFVKGLYSHAEGEYNLAIGEATHAEGYANEVDGKFSHAEGYYNNVTGKAAHAEGYSTIAAGDYSHAEGYTTTADNFSSHVSGKFNKALTTGGAINTQIGDAFVIGNGISDSEKSNALRIDYTGAVYGIKAYNASGADYAEYFEWLDGNSNDEDRIGYFVTLDNNKIKIATTDDYILGIISANPCIIGNSDEDWLGKYLHDEFGRFIYEDVEEEIQTIDIKTKQITTVKTGNIIKNGRLKLNPNYDPTKEYITRASRPEWDLVGMLGVICVRDDGTCQVNGYCAVNSNGIATNSIKSVNTYRVISRINDNIIKIIFK